MNRGEPPDIDVDFEHERREEVIQYIYERYGRDRAADLLDRRALPLARRAIREVGKVMGLTEDVSAALAKTVWGYSDGLLTEHVRQAGPGSHQSGDPPGRASRRRIDRLSAPPLAACRRLCAHARAARRNRADRQCRHGRPHRHRMGQGRYRHALRPDEGRCARARHAELSPPRAPISCSSITARAILLATLAAGRSRGLRDALRAPDPSACFRSKAAHRCLCCRA